MRYKTLVRRLEIRDLRQERYDTYVTSMIHTSHTDHFTVSVMERLTDLGWGEEIQGMTWRERENFSALTLPGGEPKPLSERGKCICA